MAQWRKWHSDASTSKAIWLNTRNPLSPMLFPYIIAHMDDDGRMEYHPASTMAVVCPLAGKVGITPEVFDEAVNDLVAVGLLIRYASGNQEFLSAIPAKWQERQPVRKDRHKPSSHPAPPLGNQVTTNWQPSGNRDNDTDHDTDTDKDQDKTKKEKETEKASFSLGTLKAKPPAQTRKPMVDPLESPKIDPHNPYQFWQQFKPILTTSDSAMIATMHDEFQDIQICDAMKIAGDKGKHLGYALAILKRNKANLNGDKDKQATSTAVSLASVLADWTPEQLEAARKAGKPPKNSD